MDTRQKLGAPGRHHLRQLEEGSDSSTPRLSLFLRGREAFSPVQLAELERDGAQIRTTAGNILTADVPVEAVDRVLSHDFIVSGDVSAPLYLESEGEPHIDIG